MSSSATAAHSRTFGIEQSIALLRDGRHKDALKFLQVTLQDVTTELTNPQDDPASIDLNDFRGKILLTSESISLYNGNEEDDDHHLRKASVIFNRAFSFTAIDHNKTFNEASEYSASKSFRDGQLAIQAAVALFNMGLGFQLYSLTATTAKQPSLQKKAATFYQSLIQLLESFEAVDDNPLTILYLAAHANLTGMYAETRDLDHLSQMSENFLQAFNRITDPGPYREEMEHLVVIATSLGFTNLWHAAAA